LGLSWG